jgi:lipopolysaccharide/colanic/teichoic acid biosynthesis glycosyltransferase
MRLRLYNVIKRCIDLFIAGIVLVIVSPVLLIIMLLLRFTGEGEVFYLQERIGYKNKKFYIWKFATMLKNSPNIGTGDVTVKNDPRLIPLGKFLRKTKLNELPQIMNIINGDMTLIGPRPLMERGFLRYPPNVQNKIYDVKPGITGIGSIVFRDEETLISCSVDFETTYRKINQYKGELELWYQNNRSFTTDMLLLFVTAWVIIYPQSRMLYSLFPSLPSKNHEEFVILNASMAS